MAIFGKSTVIGVAANDEQATKVVSFLKDKGILEANNENLSLISQSRIQSGDLKLEDGPVTIPSSGASNSTNVPPVPAPKKEWVDQGLNEATLERAESALDDVGVSGEEAKFYARQIGRDNTVVAIKVDKDKVSAARDAFNQANLNNIATP